MRGLTWCVRAAGVTLAAGALSAGALGQQRTQVAQARDRGGPSEGLSVSLTPRYEHSFDADLRDSRDGSVQIHRAGATLNLGGAINESLRWGLDTDYEASWYDFNDATDLIPSGRNPFQEVHQLRFTPTLFWRIDEAWSVVGGPVVQFAGERDADVGDSATYGGFVAGNYRLSENLSLSFGVRAVTELESDASVIPLLGVTWKISEQVTLRTRGPKLEVAAEMTPDLTLALFGGYDSREYRLADDAEIPEGVMRDRRGRVGVALRWRAWEGATISVEGGADVYQRFYFDDKDGNRVGADRTRPAPFVGVNAEFRF